MTDLYENGSIISDLDDLEDINETQTVFYGHAIKANKNGIWGEAQYDDDECSGTRIVNWEIVAANLKKYRPDLMGA